MMDMTRHVMSALVVVGLMGGLASCSPKGDGKAVVTAAETPLTVTETASVSTTARVTRVDYATRQVTLQDESGTFTTIVAGPEVRRLNEVQVGDDVTAEYTVSLVAELRPATADELANPVAAVVIAGRAGAASAPGAGAMQGVRVVTTVAAVDQASMKVTLKGPGGDTVTVQGRKPENVRKLRVGDTIVITYVEAVAVSLTKVGRP
jgi:hypothetical protein